MSCVGVCLAPMVPPNTDELLEPYGDAKHNVVNTAQNNYIAWVA